ncbi:MAG: GNAT family N-acetyltransferase [Paenisporosarcina sp.]
MNLKLEKMNEEEFDKYLEFFMLDYAQDLSENFNIPLDKATEESKGLMNELLPNKQNSDDQFLFTIHCPEKQEKVGMIWYSIQPEIDRAYIYHIYIYEGFRKMGYASSVLQDLEVTVKNSGITSLGLSVFGENQGAHRLYKKLGYQTFSISMGKNL